MNRRVLIFLGIAFGIALLVDSQRFLNSKFDIDSMSEDEWRWVDIIGDDNNVLSENHLLLGNVLFIEMDMAFCFNERIYDIELEASGIFSSFDENKKPKLVKYAGDDTYYYVYEKLPNGDYSLNITSKLGHFLTKDIQITDEYNMYNRFEMSDLLEDFYLKTYVDTDEAVLDANSIRSPIQVIYQKNKDCQAYYLEINFKEASDSVELWVKHFNNIQHIEKVEIVNDNIINELRKVEVDLFNEEYAESLYEVEEVVECEISNYETITFLMGASTKTYHITNCDSDTKIKHQLDEILKKYVSVNETPEEMQN